MTEELEDIWKEAVVAYFNSISWYTYWGTEENKENLTG
jgi:hypothetical protein